MTTNGVKPSRGIRVRFPGVALAPIDEPARIAPQLQIGWFLGTDDVHAASTRYRCHHFARALSGAFESRYFTKFAELKAAAPQLDAIIIVKRLDRAVFDVVALARTMGCPLFLDLCDDIMSPDYPSRDEAGMGLTALAAAAPVLAGIVVPSAVMAERVEGYLAGCGLSGPICHVIPDIAETRELYAATEQFVTGTPSALLSGRKARSGPERENRPKSIVWFGNFGAAHSNFGMYSLKPRFKALRLFSRTCPIELVIISNSRPVYDALVADCGFPVRYVAWSPQAVYDALECADAALLTTGDDAFCDVKSSNRVLQALVAGVPVIADRSDALAEFDEVIFAGSTLGSLESCLGPDSSSVRERRQALAARLLMRFTPERLAAIWDGLLRAAIGRAAITRAGQTDPVPLLVLDAGDDIRVADAAVRALNGSHGSHYRLLVSTDLLNQQPAAASVLNRARPLPNFFSGKVRSAESVIRNCSPVLVGSRGTPGAKSVIEAAGRIGREVKTFADAGSLPAMQPARGPVPPARPAPGPWPAHADPDGSYEWVFVIHSNARGWILDAICQEIGSRQPKSWAVVDHTTPPPPARNYFFSHFGLLDTFDRKYAEHLAGSRVFLWYTHPRDETAETIARSLDVFSRTTRVVFTCEGNRQLWIRRGMNPEQTAVVLGAADPDMFLPHQRGGGVVGLSSSFYERKNPDLLLEVVRALPHRSFTLIGRNWNRYARFEELRFLPNFHYTSASYRDYPRLYSTFDVFLSMSSLEGGPIPLVEAMMCNAVPVVSRTGLAPDLIRHGENGYIFDIDDSADRVAALIEQAYANQADVRATVERYSWDRFSSEIVALAQ